MSFRLNADPFFSFRKFEKLMLAVRLFWRLPRSHGARPKFEYLKPWIVDQCPMAVIDVGINIGQFLHFAYRLWPDAKIIGVEPTADKMPFLYKDDTRVVVGASAASDHAGEATFHITKNSQNSSLLGPSDSFVADQPGDGLLRTETVQLCRMDDILRDETGPFFNGQGAEMDVLRGFGDRLADIETLIVETPFEEAYNAAVGFDGIYRYLADRGMDYAGPLGTLTSKKTERVRQEDAVFVKR
jgi:FkbM family methyltransferase